MASYFFDTSAIIKRYVSEIGSAWVNGIVLGSTIHRDQTLLARITAVEVVAAISRRRHAGSIPAADAGLMIVQFCFEFANLFRIVAVTPRLVASAMVLAESHTLRGYDAVQLAAALSSNTRRLRRSLSPLTLISSDAALNAAAVAEGLAVDDPNAHP